MFKRFTTALNRITIYFFSSVQAINSSQFPLSLLVGINEIRFDQGSDVFRAKSHNSARAVMEFASNAYINQTSFWTFSYA